MPFLRGWERTPLNFVDVHITVHDGVDGESTDAFHAELLGDIFSVADDRCKANVKLAANFFVDEALCNECKYFDFAVGEQFRFERFGHFGQIPSAGMSILL